MDVTSLVQSLPTGVFAFVEVFLLLFAGVFAVAGVHARRRAALIERTTTSPIGFAEDGYREFEGTIEASGEDVVAPLTGWPCAWYRAKVERHAPKRRDGSGGRWEQVSSSESQHPIVLRDATGACLVKPRGAEVTPTDFSVWYGATADPEDRNPERRAPTQSRTPTLEIAGGTAHRYRYTEERIYVGDPLFALGHFTSGRFSGAAAGDVLDPDEAEPEPAEQATGIRATLATGAGQPLVLSTTSQAAHVAMSQFGGEMALYMAAIPAAAAVMLAFVRAH